MAKILCHIGGPSGSGKTSLLEEIKREFSESIHAIDLDEFDEKASEELGLDVTKKKSWKTEDIARLAALRQLLMDRAIASSHLPLIFAGHHREDAHILIIPTKNRFLLDVDAHTAALRAYQRSQKSGLGYQRRIEDLPFEEKAAQEEIDFLTSQEYQKKSAEEVLQFIRSNLK